MNALEKEEFVTMKSDISYIKRDVEEIKKILKEHTEWESKKYDELDSKYASKLVERIVYSLVGIISGAVVLALVYLVVK